MITRRERGLFATAVAVALALAGGCGGGGHKASPAQTTASPTTVAPAGADETTTAPPGSTAGLDDLNGDGQPEPTCGTRDFKAGLVLRVLCDTSVYASEPKEGTAFVEGSLGALPGIPDDLKGRLLEGVSADAIRARDVDGHQVFVFFITSDTLFDVGSAALLGPARETLAGLTHNIQATWPGAPVQVRGHTDATGNPAANQRLSEQRASAVADYLASQGIDRGRLSSVGLGSTVPIVLEKNPDGSDNPEGRHQNRRVELVVRVP